MKKVKIFLLTTLLVGTLNGTAGIIQYLLNGKKNPAMIFKFVSSGVFGKKAFFKGDIMVIYGIGLHYLIAGIWVLFFFSFYPKKKRADNLFLAGTIYGVIVWLSMNLIIVPLSNTPKLSADLTQGLINLLILIAAVGIPIATIQKKYA
jgi:hypothetical protein